MTLLKTTVGGALALATLTLTAQAQTPGRANVAAVSATASPAHVGRGGQGTLTVTLLVAPKFHVNAHKTNDPDLIATDFAPSAPAGVTFGAARYPAPRLLTLDGKPTPVYMGRTVISIPFSVSKTAHAGTASLGGQLTYQGCNAASCFPPKTVPVKAAVAIR